jgi:AcrR family transcriptional regulator
METKERIIVESSNLFRQFGIKSITMDQIAENLGVSKRTIYEIFGTKDDLLNACIDYRIKEDEKASREIMNHAANIIEAFLIQIRKSIDTMNSISPLFILDAKKFHSRVFSQKMKEQEIYAYNNILAFLKTGKEQGYFKKQINVDIVTKLIIEQFKIIGNDTLFPPDAYSKSEIFENIAVNFLRGIATIKGLKIIDDFNI